MEEFREHEKEFKTKPYSKKALQNARFEGNGNEDSDEDGYNGEEMKSDGDDEEENKDLWEQEREWLELTLNEKLKTTVMRFEEELELMKNKKGNRTGTKRQKEILAMSGKLQQSQKVKTKLEEILNLMEYLEGGEIQRMQVTVSNYLETKQLAEEEFHGEIDRLMESADKSKQRISQCQQMEMDKKREQQIKEVIDFEKHSDVLKQYQRVEQVPVGQIIDAQDQYGAWHLGIVIDERNTERKIRFLPYPNSNRDEDFKDEDSGRIAPAFTQTELPGDPQNTLNKLRKYLEDYRQKKKQQPKKRNQSLKQTHDDG